MQNVTVGTCNGGTFSLSTLAALPTTAGGAWAAAAASVPTKQAGGEGLQPPPPEEGVGKMCACHADCTDAWRASLVP